MTMTAHDDKKVKNEAAVMAATTNPPCLHFGNPLHQRVMRIINTNFLNIIRLWMIPFTVHIITELRTVPGRAKIENKRNNFVIE
mmetsp:Transcript_23442/g.54462  ORF Transcript_23442/g.54462 Transcript_23442/m.54462 type:complete len:84 (+) Transcript_23442:198-449(+)